MHSMTVAMMADVEWRKCGDVWVAQLGGLELFVEAPTQTCLGFVGGIRCPFSGLGQTAYVAKSLLQGKRDASQMARTTLLRQRDRITELLTQHWPKGGGA